MKENESNALKEMKVNLHDEILSLHQIKSSVKMQSQDILINPVQAMDDSLIVSKSSLIDPENKNAFSKSEIETQMQRQEEKVDMREAIDAGLVVTESSGKKPDKQDTRAGEIDQDALLNAELLKTKDMSVENADLKAQIQEKVFANAALKNELRKLKGNIVDSKFAKASI
ncbi:hypothetical protein Tco_1561327 [Tanacetum coccineum]